MAIVISKSFYWFQASSLLSHAWSCSLENGASTFRKVGFTGMIIFFGSLLFLVSSQTKKTNMEMFLAFQLCPKEFHQSDFELND